MINGGLGFKLAADTAPMVYSRKGAIAYGVIAAVMFVTWMGAIFIGFLKRRQRAAKMESLASQGSDRGAVFAAGDVRGSSDRSEAEKDVAV